MPSPALPETLSAFEELRLPDGRNLDFRISGPETGMPLVFHHATPGAGTPLRTIDRALHDHGFKTVRTSRPGYGGSTRHAGRAVVDVVGDIRALLDWIGVEECVVVGGGPHALACAARLRGVRAALVIASVAPYGAGFDFMEGMGEGNLIEFRTAEGGEEALRTLVAAASDEIRSTPAENVVESLPAADRAVLTEELGEDLAAGFEEALRAGIDGWVDDDLAFTKPWGFEVEEIAIPTALWLGSADRMVPFAHGQWLTAHIPGVVAHLEEGEGHLSIALGAIDQMIDEFKACSG